MPGVKRPTTATVFGVLSILFGILGLLGSVFSVFVFWSGDPGQYPLLPMIENPEAYVEWARVEAVVGAVFSVVLMVSGVGLLQVREWARRLAIGYGVFGVVNVLLGIAVQLYVYGPIPDASGAGHDPAMMGLAIGVIVSSGAGLIYPILLLFFMTRPGLRATFRAWPNPPMPEPPYAPPPGALSPASGVDGENPYAPPTAPVGDPPGAAGPSGDELISKLVPSRNKPALVGYYLGLFALLGVIPLIGLVGIALAAVAVPSGIVGLRRVRQNPAVRGKVHAWVGVICGVVGGGIGLFVHGLMLFALLAR